MVPRYDPPKKNKDYNINLFQCECIGFISRNPLDLFIFFIGFSCYSYLALERALRSLTI